MLTMTNNVHVMQNELVCVPVEIFAMDGAFTQTLCTIAFSFRLHQGCQSFEACSHSSPCRVCKQLGAHGVCCVSFFFF